MLRCCLHVVWTVLRLMQGTVAIFPCTWQASYSAVFADLKGPQTLRICFSEALRVCYGRGGGEILL